MQGISHSWDNVNDMHKEYHWLMKLLDFNSSQIYQVPQQDLALATTEDFDAGFCSVSKFPYYS
jgi:hypothetical protein